LDERLELANYKLRVYYHDDTNYDTDSSDPDHEHVKYEIKCERLRMYGWIFAVPSICYGCTENTSFESIAQIVRRDFLISEDGTVILHLLKQRFARYQPELGTEPFQFQEEEA